MLIHHRKSVLLSLTSTDLPVWSVTKTAATLEQKDCERFNLLLTVPPLPKEKFAPDPDPKNPRLLWLEISPYRVTMTMQANASLNYRHFWEQGVYGTSHYWLNNKQPECDRIRLRNFTRRLTLVGRPIPQLLRVEYELWSEKVQLGTYILNLEIQQ